MKIGPLLLENVQDMKMTNKERESQEKQGDALRDGVSLLENLYYPENNCKS